MRVLHVVGRSHGRGAELAALDLAYELDRRGHENRVVACNPSFDGGTHPRLSPLSHRVRMDPIALTAAALRLRRISVRERYDVVLTHGGWAATVAVLARRRGSPALVWQRILGFPPGFRGSWRARLWRMLARHVDAAVALTPEMRTELRALGFRGPVWIIPNFRQPHRFTTVDRDDAGATLRASLGLDDGHVLIGLVGHLIAQKRPERAVAVLRLVRDAGEPAHLVVAGAGPQRDFVARAAREFGVDDAIHLVGHRDDVENVLGGIDVLVLTSDDEGIPGVLIEAQMSGCPVVTFPFAGAASVVVDRETGIVLANADLQAMADEVVALLRDPLLRTRMGQRGRDRSQSFSSARAAARYEAHLAEAAQARSAARRPG